MYIFPTFSYNSSQQHQKHHQIPLTSYYNHGISTQNHHLPSHSRPRNLLHHLRPYPRRGGGCSPSSSKRRHNPRAPPDLLHARHTRRQPPLRHRGDRHRGEPGRGRAVPFAKPNGAVLPVNNGVPTNNANGGILNNNNVPFLTGLSGFTSNIGSNSNSNSNNGIIGGMPGFPVLNSAQFPSGSTLQKLMFGTMTVFDDEVTEGHELGSGLVGKAQGFYIYSSVDGNSQTMAFTVMFAAGGYADSITFFGVHRTAVAESHLAIMGGTGKHVNAKGFATVKTFPGGQHETDGMETLLQITVYLAY